MLNFWLVGVGGFFGAIARYGVSQAIQSFIPHPFPLHTLIVNFTGCLAIGVLYEYLRDHPLLPTASLVIAVGFLGAYTTFSAFSLETIQLIRSSSPGLAFANVAGSLILCLAAVALGMWIGNFIRV
ncbi:MAG: fluoride efflux transporter CrcB [Bdellovibrionales bacterium]|nr:fluoride efflux transporter CrcB [Bdellovibrionales bacterium]